MRTPFLFLLLSSCSGPAFDATEQPDAASKAPDAPTEDAPCIPDTCAAHGWNCGSLNDGCGHEVVCGTLYGRAGHGDYPYTDNGGCTASRPYFWGCDHVTPGGPAPRSDCVLYSDANHAWCCTEDH